MEFDPIVQKSILNSLKRIEEDLHCLSNVEKFFTAHKLISVKSITSNCLELIFTKWYTNTEFAVRIEAVKDENGNVKLEVISNG